MANGPRSGGRIAARLFLAGALIAFVVQVVRTAWVSDDAFITLRTVDNFINGYGLRWNVAERVQTFSHPLWLALVTIPYAVVRDPFYAVTILSMAASLITAALLAFRSSISPLRAAVAIAVLTLSRAFVDYSTSGLENPLTHLLLLLLAVVALDDRTWEDKSLALGAVAGLLGLDRLDLLAIPAPVMALAAMRGRSWRTVRNLALGFVPLVIWELFAVIYYGTPLPNTVIAKLESGIPSAELVSQGLAYLANSAIWDPVTLAAVSAALVSVAIERRPAALALAAGLLCYVALVVKVGGDFMSGRFLTGPLLLSVVLLARGRWPSWSWGAPAIVGGALALAALSPRPAFLAGGPGDLTRSNLVDVYGVADERRYYFPTSGLLNGAPGWDRPTIAARLRAHDLRCSRTTIAADGVIGVTGFFAGPRVHIIDYFGLGDPLLSRLPMVASDPFYASFMKSAGRSTPYRRWRVGHILRDIPPGYLATTLTGRNVIQDASVAELAELVRLVTRGPLFDSRRWQAILRLGLTGRAPQPRTRAPFRDTNWSEVLEIQPDSAEALFQTAQVLYRARMLGRAEDAYHEVLEQCPSHSLALIGAGRCALDRRAFSTAEDLGRRAVEAAPGDSQGYVILSFAMRGARRFEEGAALLESLAARDPTLAAPAFELLGELWSEAGNLDRARAAYARALERDPEFADAHNNLGIILAQASQVDGAIVHFRAALESRPDDPELRLNLAHAYEMKGMMAEAAEQRSLATSGAQSNQRP